MSKKAAIRLSDLRFVSIILFFATILAVATLPTSLKASEDQTLTFFEWMIPTADSNSYRITLDSKGNVWFAEAYGDKIGRLDPDTNRITEWDVVTSGSAPFDIVVDTDGNIWFTEFIGPWFYTGDPQVPVATPGGLGKLDPNTNTVTEWNVSHQWNVAKYPWGIAIDPSGCVWFGQSLQPWIARFDSSTNTITEWYLGSSHNLPEDVVCDASGKVWFTDAGHNKISKFEADTAVLTSWVVPSTSSGVHPHEICIDNFGNIWFTIAEASKIGKLNPETNIVTEWQVPTAGCWTMDLTVDGKGYVWFTEGPSNKIGKFDQSTSGVSMSVTPTTAILSQVIQFSTTPNSKIQVPISLTVTPLPSLVSGVSTNGFAEWDIPTPNAYPIGVVTDYDGNVWFTERKGNKIGMILLDSDGDGLTDAEELIGWDITIYDCEGNPIGSYHVTSDPYKADTDSDGLSDLEEKDGWNVRYRLRNPTPPPRWIWVEYHVSSDPGYADIDADGLNDWQEKVHKTDPNRANTDCDGAWDTNDGFEVTYGLNPLDFDTDDDGLSDGVEIDLWIIAAGYSPEDPSTVPEEVLNWATSKTSDPVIPAFIDVDPDTLNLKSNGEWITAYIELPEGYNVEDIDISTVMLNSTIPVDPDAPTQIGDCDLDGIVDLMVKFDRVSIIEWLGTIDYSESTGKSYFETLTMTGTVLDTPFEGSYTIKILHK